VNLTSERGLIELSLTSSMSRSSSKSTLHFDCQWLVQPSTSQSSVVLQFLSLRLFASAASPPTSSKTKSSCSESFVEVQVGKNLVSSLCCFFSLLLLASGSSGSTSGTGIAFPLTPILTPGDPLTEGDISAVTGSVIVRLTRLCPATPLLHPS